MPENTLRIECVHEVTLESRVWQGPWEKADLFMCHDDEISIYSSDDRPLTGMYGENRYGF